MSKKVSEVLNESMAKVRDMVDANTVIGSPVQIGADMTMIPISKINFGLASGGTDMAAKDASAVGTFGGGAGCYVKIVPVAMIMIQGERVRMIPIDEPASTAAERAIEQIPILVDKLTDLIRGTDSKDDSDF